MFLKLLLPFCFFINESLSSSFERWKVTEVPLTEGARSLNIKAPPFVPVALGGLLQRAKEEEVVPLYSDQYTRIYYQKDLSGQEIADLIRKYANVTMIFAPLNLKHPMVFGAPGSGRIKIEAPAREKVLPPPYMFAPPSYTPPPPYCPPPPFYESE
jgi:hypothetical protein